MSGHVFVVRGDLVRLSCDALLVPGDAGLHVSRWWGPLFGDALDASGDWLRLPGPAPEGFGRTLRAYDTGHRHAGRALWLMQTGVDDPTPERVVDAVVEAVRASGRTTARAAGRAKPLVGLPLVGTGAGGLAGQRGTVLRLLIARLQEVTSELDVDVALVLDEPRDFAAAQVLREDGGWALPTHLLAQADALGRRAASDGLSLFIGAGASVPLGLPDWDELVRLLCAEAGTAPEEGEAPAAATSRAVAALPPGALDDLVRGLFAVEQHTLAHGLLASLRVRQVVTTNYDNAYELAHEGAHRGARTLHVMTRQVPGPGADWLLKLHGDALGPGPVVLTREQFAAMERTGAPLRGVVQSLLMTSHVVFVGYSLRDDTFVRLAREVREVLSGAEGSEPYRGTALAIAPDPALAQACSDDLLPVTMPVDSDDPAVRRQEGARLLEVFLDRLLWTASRADGRAAQFLLDERYRALVDAEPDVALRERVTVLLRDVGQVRESLGWPVLREALERLGADPLDEPQAAPARRRSAARVVQAP